MTINSYGTLLIAVPLLSLPNALIAGDQVDERHTASAQGVVEIHNTRGEIDISGWDKEEVYVTGELDDLAEEFIFNVDGDFTLIRVKLPRHNVSWGDGSDLDIKVPRGSRIDFSGVSTDLKLSGIEGGSSLHSVSGDMQVSHIAKRLLINSVSGEVKVRDATGKAKITTVSGDLDLDLNTNEVSVSAVSGEIDMEMAQFDSLRTETVSGDIRISGQLNTSGDISIKSVSGEIRTRLHRPVNARIDVKTGPGGDINNNITDDTPKRIFPAQMELKTSAGDGSGRIRIKTVTGDVSLDSGS